jgi:hypothetical protein
MLIVVIYWIENKTMNGASQQKFYSKEKVDLII